MLRNRSSPLFVAVPSPRTLSISLINFFPKQNVPLLENWQWSNWATWSTTENPALCSSSGVVCIWIYISSLSSGTWVASAAPLLRISFSLPNKYFIKHQSKVASKAENESDGKFLGRDEWQIIRLHNFFSIINFVNNIKCLVVQTHWKGFDALPSKIVIARGRSHHNEEAIAVEWW